MDLRTPQGQAITCWEEWTRPKRDYHWKEGRSAMELAKAWFRRGQLAAPQELNELLNTEPRLKGLAFERAIPELVTRLPERGEGRNHDLWLLGRTSREQVTVCVEAKADESFGNDTVAGYLHRSLRRRQRSESTRVPERVEALLQLVDSDNSMESPNPWHQIPYQLLTAVSGSVLQARSDGSDLVVLVVYVFETAETKREKLDANAAAFANMVRFLTNSPVEATTPTQLYGPVSLMGIGFYVGKAVFAG